jgi:hypothetical protein
VSRARRYHTDHADVGAGLVGAAKGSDDDIVDLGAAATLKTNEQARTEANSIGTEQNKATGQKNSIASALTVKH